MICLAPTKEREQRYGWDNEKIRTGWFADGDYESLLTAERYYLPRDLDTVKNDDSNTAAVSDALFSLFPAYLDYRYNDDPRFDQFHDLWGAKTQGMPYHMYLLAIACLIESRLGPKACVYGDITKGQCRKAVEMANKYLDREIDLPVRCDSDKLYERIQILPVSEIEQLQAYLSLYLGETDASFGLKARRLFSEQLFDKYWTERFGRFSVQMRGFDRVLYDYLLWGLILRNWLDMFPLLIKMAVLIMMIL